MEGNIFDVEVKILDIKLHNDNKYIMKVKSIHAKKGKHAKWYYIPTKEEIESKIFHYGIGMLEAYNNKKKEVI